MEEKELNSSIYNKNNIEFVTVASEVCMFIETVTDFQKKDFIDRSLRLLSLLYLKALLLQIDSDATEFAEDLEDFVEEQDYEQIRENIATILEKDDRYLDVFLQDMTLCEEGVSCDISEDLADIYQDLKNFLLRFQIGNEDVMLGALYACEQSFRTYWGQRLLCAQKVLHNVRFFTIENEEVDELDDDCECNCCSHKHKHEHHHDHHCNCHHHDHDANELADLRTQFFNHQR